MIGRLLTLHRRRLVVKITGLSVVLVCLTILYFALETYERERWLNQARFGKGLQRIVQVAALDLRAEDVAASTGEGPEARRALRRLQRTLRDIRQVTEFGPQDALFVVRVPDPAAFEGLDEAAYSADGAPTAALPLAIAHTPIDPDAVDEETLMGPAFTALADVEPEPGQQVRFHRDARAAVWRAVTGGDSSYSSLYEVPRGERINGFAALKTTPADGTEGRVVALLVAQQDLSDIFDARWGIFWDVILRSTAVVLLAMLLGGFLSRNIGRALQRIRRGAQAIKDQDYTHRVDVRRDDELGLVAEQFNEMAATLAQRVQLLKFVPAYTLEAAIRRTRGQSLEVEALEGTIMFSDIRGYTTLSTGIPVERVVEMLNVYLRRQAEVLARHGGVIDKFIGDAVLGVFMGDDHAARAVACGLEIQAAVRSMNAEQAFDFPIHVGVGVASGNLVLAEIGSDERRERTLIGSVVNLASRLCGRASAHEVLVDEGARLALGERLVVARREEMELKGFKGLRPVFAAAGVKEIAGRAPAEAT